MISYYLNKTLNLLKNLKENHAIIVVDKLLQFSLDEKHLTKHCEGLD